MIGDCDNCGHSAMYHLPFAGCIKCSCGEFVVRLARLACMCGFLVLIGCSKTATFVATAQGEDGGPGSQVDGAVEDAIDSAAAVEVGLGAGGVGGSSASSGGSAGSSPDGAAGAVGASGSGGIDAGGGSSGSGGSSGGSGGANSSGGSSSADGGVVCTTGAVRCSGLQPQTCISNIWLGNGAACSGSKPVCLDGACVACSPGAHGCTDSFGAGKPETCGATGSWVVGAACPSATPACSQGECVLCTGELWACQYNGPTCPSGYTACCKSDGTCGCAMSFGGACQ